MSSSLRVAVTLFVFAGLTGCATTADLQKVRQELRDARAMVADQQVAVEGLRRRLEVIRSEIGDQGRKPNDRGVSESMALKVADLETRLAGLEQGRTAEATDPQGENVTPPASDRAATGATPVPTPAQSAQDLALAKEEALQGTRVDADYRDAVQLIRQGQCSQAVPKLRDFIRRSGKSEFADNAQFLIGSCYYGQRDFNRAIIELNEVLIKYPKGDKVPAALLTLADAFADSGDKLDARLILQKLVSEHPRSEEAERGRQKLQSLGS